LDYSNSASKAETYNGLLGNQDRACVNRTYYRHLHFDTRTYAGLCGLHVVI
jgi:negative regulator of sigma E activity